MPFHGVWIDSDIFCIDEWTDSDKRGQSIFFATVFITAQSNISGTYFEPEK